MTKIKAKALHSIKTRSGIYGLGDTLVLDPANAKRLYDLRAIEILEEEVEEEVDEEVEEVEEVEDVEAKPEYSMDMSKDEMIAELKKLKIEHDPKANKEVLLGLLNEA